MYSTVSTEYRYGVQHQNNHESFSVIHHGARSSVTLRRCLLVIALGEREGKGGGVSEAVGGVSRYGIDGVDG